MRQLLALLLGVAATAALVATSTTATAGSSCAGAPGSGGYTYAGHQSSHIGHGVRATITLTREAAVAAGHVAGWVGVGGPGQGANGEDAWIQTGIAELPGMDPVIYAEITRNGREPQLLVVPRARCVQQTREQGRGQSAVRPQAHPQHAPAHLHARGNPPFHGSTVTRKFLIY